MPRFQPVRWMALAVAVLGALLGTTALTEALPPKVVGYMGLALAVLTAVLGEVARTKVTPLADPKDTDGKPLERVP